MLLVNGCSVFKRSLAEPKYVVPQSYLQHCKMRLWQLPEELEDAYVEAAMCAKRGNDDKSRIRKLIEDGDE